MAAFDCLNCQEKILWLGRPLLDSLLLHSEETVLPQCPLLLFVIFLLWRNLVVLRPSMTFTDFWTFQCSRWRNLVVSNSLCSKETWLSSTAFTVKEFWFPIYCLYSKAKQCPLQLLLGVTIKKLSSPSTALEIREFCSSLLPFYCTAAFKMVAKNLNLPFTVFKVQKPCCPFTAFAFTIKKLSDPLTALEIKKVNQPLLLSQYFERN